MKILLISPPVSNIGQAAPSISVLSTWLRSLGHECLQWDLGIEVFEHFHSAAYLYGVAAQYESERGRNRWGFETARVRATYSRFTADQLTKALARLKTPGVERDLASMVSCIRVIRESGALISASHGLCRLDYSHYDIVGAFASWETLRETVTSAERNLLWTYFVERSIPRIRDYGAELIGISVSYFSQLLPALCLTGLIKEAWPKLPVLLGGAFLKAVQDDLKTMPTWVVPADGICIGDGEPTFTAYIETLLNRGDLATVPNLLLAKNGRFVSTGHWVELPLYVPPVPMMDTDGLVLTSYLVPRYALPLPITRGCHWHRCVYCNISNQARERYRNRDTSRCIGDIRFLIERCGTDWFDFPTDSVLPRDLKRLATALVESNLKIRWAAEVLLDPRLSDELIELLAESGCCFLRFGLESACERTLTLMDKRVDLSEAARILRSCRRAGIKTGVMLIVGFPTETQAELLQTVDYLLAQAENIDFLTLHQFTVAPGSKLAAQPDLAGVHLLPRRAVLTPSLPYAHTNPVAMRPEDLPNVVEVLLDRLSEAFPQSGQLWASGIGGWLTFAASCANEPSFFKQPIPPQTPDL
jgi:anaerobic magnesium-protoporphyrin IX monomethyl ester cyclase